MAQHMLPRHNNPTSTVPMGWVEFADSAQCTFTVYYMYVHMYALASLQFKVWQLSGLTSRTHSILIDMPKQALDWEMSLSYLQNHLPIHHKTCQSVRQSFTNHTHEVKIRNSTTDLCIYTAGLKCSSCKYTRATCVSSSQGQALWQLETMEKR